MFRLQDSVPEIYTKESRDFQLFLRLYDYVNSGVRYSAKSIDNLLDPFKCNSRAVSLLCTRVGFFPKSEYNTYALRHIINVFSEMLKYKGSKKGIEIALNAILRAEKNNSGYWVSINKSKNTILILTKKAIQNQTLLEDVLSYIIPTGYTLEIGTYEKEQIGTSEIYIKDIINKDIEFSSSRSGIIDAGYHVEPNTTYYSDDYLTVIAGITNKIYMVKSIVTVKDDNDNEISYGVIEINDVDYNVKLSDMVLYDTPILGTYTVTEVLSADYYVEPNKNYYSNTSLKTIAGKTDRVYIIKSLVKNNNNDILYGVIEVNGTDYNVKLADIILGV